MAFRIEQKDRELIEKICKARGEQLSDFIRRAIKKELASLNYLSDETKKALGVLNQKEG